MLAHFGVEIPLLVTHEQVTYVDGPNLGEFSPERFPVWIWMIHDNYYGFFGDNGLPDHITAIKQLGARYSFIDTDKVGIFGHSGGGFASTDAMLRYPEFFKVAVSGAGNHDNRSYNIYWAEKYQGLLVRDTVRKTDNFAASANGTYAANLRGKLYLMHGDMDDNVHPAMTVQVIDELIKANKAFDMIWAPNRNHGLNEPYFIRRRWDYFVTHLMGARVFDRSAELERLSEDHVVETQLTRADEMAFVSGIERDQLNQLIRAIPENDVFLFNPDGSSYFSP